MKKNLPLDKTHPQKHNFLFDVATASRSGMSLWTNQMFLAHAMNHTPAVTVNKTLSRKNHDQ